MKRTVIVVPLLALGLVAGCGSVAAHPAHRVTHSASAPASAAASPTPSVLSCQQADRGAGRLLAKAQKTGTSMQAAMTRQVYEDMVRAVLTVNAQRGCPADPQLQQSLNALP
jgi:hypothetical protein